MYLKLNINQQFKGSNTEREKALYSKVKAEGSQQCSSVHAECVQAVWGADHLQCEQLAHWMSVLLQEDSALKGTA